MSAPNTGTGFPPRVIVGLLIVVFGSVLLLQELGLVDVDVWRFWPVAVIVFGIVVMLRAFRPQESPRRIQAGVVFGGGPQATAARSQRPGTLEQKMSEFAFWSGIQRRVSSPAFKRADLTAVMGGIEFDLRQAGTDQGEAVIEVFVMWGGIEIYVPPDWAVSNEVVAIMGGAEDQSRGTQSASHRLVVKGIVIMGGIDIKT